MNYASMKKRQRKEGECPVFPGKMAPFVTNHDDEQSWHSLGRALLSRSGSLN
jgi:hypothetical protein